MTVLVKGAGRREGRFKLMPGGSLKIWTARIVGVFLLAVAVPVSAAEYVIGAADVLYITVLGNKELDTVAAVNPGGKITVPLVGDVQAAGLTVDELSERLTRSLSAKIRSPVVSVSLREINSYRVYVLGTVARPGVITSKSQINLLQALALAGGVAPGADLSLAYVARGKERLNVDFRKLVIEGDLSHNIPLKPDDVVALPVNPRNSVYVMGQVQRPGAFPLDRDSQFTILKALAAAGGFTPFARPSRAVIIREEGTGKRILPADVEEITENPKKAQDILLQPGDVVIVP